jgi:hypothetical protein
VALGQEIAYSRRILADLKNDQIQFAKCLKNMFLAAARNELAVARQALAIERGKCSSKSAAQLALLTDRQAQYTGEQFESLKEGVAAIVADEVLAGPLAPARIDLAGDAVTPAFARQASAIERGKCSSKSAAQLALLTDRQAQYTGEQFESLKEGVAAIVADLQVLVGPYTGEQCFETFEEEIAAIMADEVLADPQALVKLKSFSDFILGGVVERAELMNKFAIS